MAERVKVEERSYESITVPKPTYEVPPKTRATIERKIQANLIRSATVHFPPGCNSLVDFALHIGGKGNRLLPSSGRGSGWISLDDFTKTYPLNRPVDGKVKLIFIWRNRDTEYSHRVPATVVYA